MQLEVRLATPSDVETAKSIYGPETGDLVAALAQVAWPVEPTDLTALKRRADWSCQQQKELLENDPSTHLVKVVDADKDGEMVAFGRWHRYPNGYEHAQDLEVAGLKSRDDPATWPSGCNKALYLGLIDPLLAERRQWMGTGHYWVLTNIETREPLRRHGAGSLILKWGLEQAAKDGVPAYLEAVAEAKGLYEKHGFRDVGRVDVDCTPFGLSGVTLELARMRADPQ